LLWNFHAVWIDKETSAIQNDSGFTSIENFCMLVLHRDYELCMFVEERNATE